MINIQALFTPERRQEVLDDLIMFFRADDDIAGLVLVGADTPTVAVNDPYGGLWLRVVLKNGAVFPSVYTKWRKRLYHVLPAAYLYDETLEPDQVQLHLLLDDYLEISLLFTRLVDLRAVRKPWCVLFDQTEAKDIRPTLEATQDEQRVSAPVRTYQELMQRSWQPIVRCVAALKRGETWRALHMLDQVRDAMIQIAAINHNLEARGYAEVDQLPEMFLVRLRHTLPTDSSEVAIRRALRMTLQLFFSVAEEFETAQEDAPRLIEEFERWMRPYSEAFA